MLVNDGVYEKNHYKICDQYLLIFLLMHKIIATLERCFLNIDNKLLMTFYFLDDRTLILI